ncbi:hypothetical protein NE237_020851 [Protea cynaroides]|uniref:Bidirectional sugar transporter SWEET n=1 Tax=Protea cynaroides TaxID=273540 RepID=A0A9Q0H987_9MAGN|nr:hypothetical protein NE237_020851 [Protea cynaroides]
MVYLAPLPTFYRVYKKKSTEEFHSMPYVVALFSAMLWTYYAFLKSEAYLLITINSIGCVIEAIYISMFMTYAPNTARILTAKLILLLNLGVYSLILLLTLLLVKNPIFRVRIVGWVCVVVSVSVFVAPLTIMRMVIRTKSVEFMPLPLSFFLTLSAVMWFCYGLLLKDLYIALPNTLGFIFGVLQMGLYILYKDSNKVKGHLEEKMPEEEMVNVLNLKATGTMEILLEEGHKHKVNGQSAAGDLHHQKTTATPTGVDDIQLIVSQV